jgi:D-alanyl-D-alanine carboxypeptidase
VVKIIWTRLLFVGALLLTISSTAQAKYGPSLVFDARTGEVLVADRAGVPWYPASLTKLMTAYVTFRALRSGQITLDTKLTISQHAAKRPPSKIGLKAGSKVSVDFALKAILIHSANDMAETLAEGIGGSLPGFAARMNAQARRLGMTGTNYVNPHGLFDKAQVTTARDLGILASTILSEFPQYRRYFNAKSMHVGKRTLKNRNKLARKFEWIDGMKTGYLCNSGYNLVASATVNGRRLVSISLGARSGRGRNEFSRVLLEWSGTAASRSNLRLAKIHNTGGKPKNIRQSVCKKPKRVTWGKLNELGGWGVSLGQFKSAFVADAILQGRVLISRRFLSTGKLGVFRALQPKQYLAVLSQMNQSESLTLCNFLRRRNAYCEVMTPQTFASFLQQRAAAKVNKKKQTNFKARREQATDLR